MTNNNQTLVIIDMQNDFITGSLANPDAKAIVPEICKLVSKWKGDMYFTKDTHGPDYLNTAEGRHLPVKHCLKDSAGWCIHDDILDAYWKWRENNSEYCSDFICKPSFGSLELARKIASGNSDNVVLVGTCTDICVISNALLIKASCPEREVTVISDLCAGVTKEKHEAALETMRSCQVNVVTLEEFMNSGKKVK